MTNFQASDVEKVLPKIFNMNWNENNNSNQKFLDDRKIKIDGVKNEGLKIHQMISKMQTIIKDNNFTSFSAFCDASSTPRQ